MTRFWTRLRLTLEMIKFEHSVFALPFALTGALLALREDGFSAPGLWTKLLWIMIAMVGGMVGVAVIALYLPMFNIINLIK